MERLRVTHYAIGDIVELFCGKFFVCTMEGTTANSPLIYYDDSGTIVDGTVVWKLVTNSDSSGSGAGIKNWKANESYKLGDVIIYEDSVYQCIVGNSDNIFTESHWKQLSNAGEISRNYVNYIASTLD